MRRDARRRTVLVSCGSCGAPARLRRLGLLVVVVALGVLGGAPVVLGHDSDGSVPTGAGGSTVVDLSTAPSPAGDPGRELVELRTRTSRTYTVDGPRGEQGSRLARVSASSVNYRDADGEWRAIDNALEPVLGGFENRANRYHARLPGSLGGGGEVSVSEGGDTVGFSLRDAADGRGRVDGAQITYPDVFAEVDVRYRAQADLLKELVMLKSRSARRSFVYDLKLSDGLRPVLSDSGALELRDGDGDGEVAMSVPSPFMVDADGERSHAVEFALDRVESGWRLTLEAQDEWLDRPERAWPVAVDPQVVPYAQADCSLDQFTPTTGLCGYGSLWVGRHAAGHDHNALLRFDVPGAIPDGVDVSQAQLGLFLDAQSAAERKRLVVNRLTRSFTSGATWNAWDGSNVWTSAGGDFDAAEACDFCFEVGGAAGGGGVQPGGWAWTGIRGLVSDWATGAKPNYGMLIRQDPAIASSVYNYFSFGSSEVAGQAPKIDIHYQPRQGRIRGHKYEAQQLTDRLGLAVNSSNGNLLLSAQDLTVPGGVGPDLQVSRTYNSEQDADGAFGEGFGMDTGPDVRLAETGAGDVVFHGPSGLRALFHRVDYTWTQYTTPAGFDAKLVQDGAAGTWTYTENQSQRKLSFDSSGRLTRDEDRNGRAITFAYNASSSEIASITDSQGRQTTFVYTGGRVTKMTDPAGRHTNYAYDTGGRLTSSTDPGAGVTSYQYCVYGPELVTTPAGRKTKIVYYTSGAMQGRVHKVIRVTNPTAAFASMTGPTTEFSYTQAQDGSATSTVTDPNAHPTVTKFDTSGRPTETTDGRDTKTKSSYTSNSNVKDFTLGANTGTTPNTTLTYDTDNNLSGSVTPTSASVCSGATLSTCIQSKTDSGTAGGVPNTVKGYQYLAGRQTDEQGRIQTLGYDTTGNPKTVAQDGNTITLNYASGTPGKLSSIVNERAKTTSYGYDTAGNLTTITPPMPLGATTLTYTGTLSRIATVTDGKNQTRTLGYDNLDRVTSIAYAGGTTLSFTYDADGNLTARTDSISGRNSSYAYDQLSRPTSETNAGATTTYAYDPASNLTSLSDAAGTTTYGYDAANRNTSVTEPGAGTAIQLGHDDDNQRTTSVYPNGVTLTRGYDQAGRMTSVKATKGTSVLQHATYTYAYTDPAAGEGTKQARMTDVLTGRITAYQYDPRNRLKRARTYTGTPPDPTHLCTTTGALACYEYAYDAASNRLSRVVTGSSVTNATTTFGPYNDANQLPTKSGLPAGTPSYTYDANGNQLTRPLSSTSLRATAYNPRDQATTIDGSTMGYLGAGQDQPITEGTKSLRHNLLGLTTRITGSTTDHYTREVDGAPLAQRTGTARQYYLTNALGSITGTTDSAGAVQATYAYDPDGTTTTTTGSSTNPLGYAAGYKAPSGLYHYGQRYYDPADARWTQQDPLNQATDLTEGNRYVYVSADPVNLVDPSGEAAALLGFVARPVAARLAGYTIKYGRMYGPETGLRRRIFADKVINPAKDLARKGADIIGKGGKAIESVLGG